MKYKECSVCGKKLPLDTTNFYANRGCLDGFYDKCKPCSIKRTQHYDKIRGPIWKLWKNMICRVRKQSPDRQYYYDKGIYVFEPWNDYQTFKKWARSHGYKAGLSIDRIDPDKPYLPGNVRFIPVERQSRNRGCVKLTPLLVKNIKHLAREGLAVKHIAEYYDITKSHVYGILKGKVWKDCV